MLQKTPLLYGFLNLLPSELSPEQEELLLTTKFETSDYR